MSTLIIAISEGVLKYGSGLLRIMLHYFLYFVSMGKKRVVPPVENPLLLLSATDIAAQTREGKILCENVISSYIDRIRQVQPYVNAVAEERFSEALEEAKKVDQIVASKVKTPEVIAEEKPLLGVPFSVKLLFSVKGVNCNAGSVLFKDLKAHEDSDVVAAMKKAGAICIATTNSPEFGLNFESFNLLYGRTSNPYDTRRTCGGSSGGEAALIGSGGSVLGLGNDLGGSIRLPAHFNGIFGHKPTNGIVSNKGVFPVPPPKINEYLCSGPMCRYAEDLIISMKVLLGPKAKSMKIGQPVDFTKLKLYCMQHDDGNPISPAIDDDVRLAQNMVIKHFYDKYGIIAKNVKIEGMKYGFRAYMNTIRSAIPKTVKDFLIGDKYSVIPAWELFKLFFRQSNLCINAIACMTADYFPFLINKRKISVFRKKMALLEETFNDILEENAILLFPTFPKKAVFHNEIYLSLAGTAYTAIFNILGYPITQCPIGISTDGLPVGIQVIAGKGQDFLTMACAVEIEKAFGGWKPPKARTKKTAKYFPTS